MPTILSPSAILGAFLDGSFTLNSVDLSDHVHKVTLKAMVLEFETTKFGDAYRSRQGALKDYVVEVEFNQDFSAAKVDATIFPILGTVVAFTARPVGAIPPAATNPEYRGNVLITDYPPLDGTVGDLARITMAWPGSGVLTRAVSA